MRFIAICRPSSRRLKLISILGGVSWAGFYDPQCRRCRPDTKSVHVSRAAILIRGVDIYIPKCNQFFLHLGRPTCIVPCRIVVEMSRPKCFGHKQTKTTLSVIVIAQVKRHRITRINVGLQRLQVKYRLTVDYMPSLLY